MASTTLRDYLQYTEDAISSGRIDEALAQCQRILSQFPEALEAQRLLGEVYLAQEQLEEAQQAFDWILTNDPENIVVYCDRALICERMADYDTALDCYQQAYELSRGNSQIRREFNKLSARVGQQGFMLSRAGLARLYMRGDLLPQAIQEWETVLASSPDRLDARTGLLEAYWREGLFEQVEELANAILSDVPGCLKALLLLAHVTSLKDIQRAEELIRRAEMLDPEMVMAQELFSDLLANQPQDPFLQLLKREDLILPEQHVSFSIPEASARSTTTTTNGSHTPADPLSTDLFSWSSLDTLIVDSQQPGKPEQDIPTFTWPSNSALDINPWSTIDQLAGQPLVSEPVVEPEQAPTAGQHTEPSSTRDAMVAPEWSQEDQMVEPVADAFDAWGSAGTLNQSEDIPDAAGESTWSMEAREEPTPPTPPAWLDMLTKSGRSQSLSAPSTQPAQTSSTGSKPEPSASEPEPEAASPAAIPATPLFAEQASPTRMPWEDDLQTVPVSESDEDEGISFGPEWLKSLGAEVMEHETAATSNPVEPAASANEEKQNDATTPSNTVDFWQEPAIDPWSGKEADQTQQEAPVHSWLEHLNASPSDWQIPIDPWQEQSVQPAQAEPAAQSEQPASEMQQAPVDAQAEEGNVERGFIGASEIDQGVSTPEQQFATLETLERDLFAQGFVPLEPGSLSKIAEEENLSSALAPFSAESQQSPIPASEDQPAQSLQQATEEPAQAEEPAAQTTTPVAQPAIPAEEPLWIAAPVPPSPTSGGPASMQEPVSQAEATIQKRPAAFNDPALDELELTMRRPVVKLQPAAQKAAGAATPEQSLSTVSRTRSGAANRVEDSSLSYKERLRKGYHHQLAGEYDEAMQEYRIIIRNAPELLGEIVSNMRALLKLAPRYAPGYRVLGDAYMRQGEYLQAMEAYNKALMMAKKGQTQRQAQKPR